MCIETLHTTILHWRKKNVQQILGLESNMANAFIQPTTLEEDAIITLVP
jgi:hypothetical protein